MTSIKCNSEFITLTDRKKAISLNFESDEVHSLEYNVKQSQPKYSSSSENISILDHNVFLPCSAISKCGRLFAFSVNKFLLLWNTSDWTLLGSGILQRAISTVNFSPDGTKIIVADKGGDVYLFLSDDISKPGNLLLGHLSLILDVIVTDDEKFIISCDRDEKVRVSCYPNAYNINSYCLGHEEFVSCVRILPHSNNVLISSSGDGTIRMWDFKSGKELLKYACLNDVATDTSYTSNYLAIRKFEMFTIDTVESGACVLFDCFKEIVLYGIKGTEQTLGCYKLQIITFKESIGDLCVNNDILWLLTSEQNRQIYAYQWKKDKKFDCEIENNKINNAVKKVNRFLDNDINVNIANNFNMLYKKQYDNVDEYYKRKSERLDDYVKKNKIDDSACYDCCRNPYNGRELFKFNVAKK